MYKLYLKDSIINKGLCIGFSHKYKNKTYVLACIIRKLGDLKLLKALALANNRAKECIAFGIFPDDLETYGQCKTLIAENYFKNLRK